MRKQLAVYNNQQPDGPYYMIILDWDWWNGNSTAILQWFDKNAPECKPASDATMFKLSNCDQYTLWQLVWNNY